MRSSRQSADDCQGDIPEACDDADDGDAGDEALGSDHGVGPLTVAQPDDIEEIRMCPSVGF
jgi:hypothetical protein